MYSVLKTASGPVKITVFVESSRIEETSDIHKLANHFPNATIDVRRFEAEDSEKYEKDARQAARYPTATLIPLFIPWLIDEKCLFLDADTLVLHDISQLYQTDLNGCLIGACRDYSMAMRHYKYFSSVLKNLSPSKSRRKRETILEAADRVEFTIHEMVVTYFNSGVILMDTPAIRKADPSGDLMNINSGRKHWDAFPDQNRLNEFFKNRTHYLDPRWNVYRDYYFLARLHAPPQFREEIFHAIKNPSLLHYLSIFRGRPWRKPWYKTRRRYRIYRQICRELEETTGIPIFRLFDARPSPIVA